MADSKQIIRTIRLEKGYKTRLKNIVKKKGFGGIEYIAEKTTISRDTISSVLKTGRCNKSNKAKLELFIDQESPIKKVSNGIINTAAVIA